MSVRKYWGAAATLAILTITNNVYAVDKQVSPAMKKKITRQFVRQKRVNPVDGKFLKLLQKRSAR